MQIMLTVNMTTEPLTTLQSAAGLVEVCTIALIEQNRESATSR